MSGELQFVDSSMANDYVSDIEAIDKLKVGPFSKEV
jgi:hypothetical protein